MYDYLLTFSFYDLEIAIEEIFFFDRFQIVIYEYYT